MVNDLSGVFSSVFGSNIMQVSWDKCLVGNIDLPVVGVGH